MWKTLNCFVTIQSPWVTLFGENLLDANGNRLEYWRVEKDDSVIILPIHKNQIIIPPPFYRHGIQTVTLDLPGGRNPVGVNPADTAFSILERELHVTRSFIRSMSVLNTEGWLVNSSFSNQKLYGYLAEIAESFEFLDDSQIQRFSVNPEGVRELLAKIHCLQCRAILLEWFLLLYTNSKVYTL